LDSGREWRKMKKVYIRSNGCIDNLLDGKSFRNYFKNNGWEIVAEPASADLILINTCAFDKKHEDISIADIKELKRYKNAQLVVTGCLPKINEERMRSVFNGTAFGPKERNTIKELIGAKKDLAWKDQHTISDEDIAQLPHRKIVHQVTKLKNIATKYANLKIFPNFEIADLTGDQESYFLVVGEGCLGNCSYCAIKAAKGKLESKPIEEVLRDFKAGLTAGHKRFIITGDDTGAYGQDLGTDIAFLLEEILKIEGDYTLNIYHLEANWLIMYFDRLKQFLKSGKIDAIFSPIQSGSNRILRAMRRPYTVEGYIQCIQQIRNELPSLKIWNQFIIGFPGETEDDFEDSLKVLDEVSFNIVQAFAYSDRPGTAASEMDHHVPEPVINKRLKKINRKIFLKVNLKKLKPLGIASG
jgi:MiaB/RimO family radical SAM methylthiotransferase